jgi:ectoine hydroxylase-related dioxygenase (phytanoyl-CoA dioxygenase family)
VTDPTAVGFRRDGFALLEGFLEPSELAPIRADVGTFLTRPLPPGCERPHNTLAPLRWNDGIVRRMLSSKRRIAALVAAVGARDLRWISGYVSVKDAHSAPLWWHQDWWCWDHPVSYRPAPSQVAVLCYLADTTANNGALRVLSGTHHRSVELHRALPEAHAHDALDLDPGHAAVRDHPDQRTVEVRAGDAVVTDYRLLHGTHENCTPQRRDCLLLTFVPSWRDLPDDVRGHLIRHPALPAPSEQPARVAWHAELLPSFGGPPRDLPLNRVAPGEFQMVD